MLETLAGIAIVLLVIVVVIAVIVLSIVRLANRMERKLGRLTRALPRSRPPGRGAPRSTRRAKPPANTAASSRSKSVEHATPTPRTPERVARAPIEPRAEMRWMGPGTTLRLHELALAGPMTYVAADRRASGAPLDPSEIIPSLPVNPRGRADPVPDWPTYAKLTPEQRSAYLKWLAGGRSDSPDDAFLLLHFFGLERRALADALDLPAIVQEVCRVRDLAARTLAARDTIAHALPTPATPAGPSTAPNTGRRLVSYMRHSGAFLWTLVAQRPDAFTERDLKILAARTGSWSEDALVSALAWFARPRPAAQPSGPDPHADASPALPAWMARIVAEQQPGARRSVVLERVRDNFDALFDTRYTEHHAPGLTLRIAKRPRILSYRPANHTLESTETSVPDAMGIASQFAPLVDLWNACIDDLRGLARVGSGQPAGRPQPGEPGAITLAQWDAMPADLKAGMESPFAAGLAQLAARHADGRGHAIVAVADVVAAMRMAHQADRQTYSAAQCQMLARAVQEAGMAIEPDARITGAGMPRAAAVALIATSIPIEPTEEASARYLAAACVLRLGAAVALADADASERELEPIAHELERAFSLSEDDHRRLDALMALLRAKGSSVKSVGKRLLAALSEDSRRSVGHLLVVVASADGVVGAAERAVLIACYRALSLGSQELEAALQALRTTPPSAPDAQPPPLILDHTAIARITAETREVAQILADAMRGDAHDDAADGASDQPENAPQPVDGREQPSARLASPAALPPDAPPPPASLPPRYAPFWTAISTRAHWPEQEASTLARSMGLMLSGAIEAINDWSFEHAGGPVLIEEDGQVVLDADRMALLR